MSNINVKFRHNDVINLHMIIYINKYLIKFSSIKILAKIDIRKFIFLLDRYLSLKKISNIRKYRSSELVIKGIIRTIFHMIFLFKIISNKISLISAGSGN